MRGSRGLRLCIASVLALLCTACSAPALTSVNQGAKAHGAKTLPLAGGPLPALPTGNLFIRAIEFHQVAGGFFASQKHVPGLIFQAEGSQLLAIQDGASVNIGPAQGFFLGPLAHTHSNPGPTENHWYFIALWPTSARSSPLVSLSASVPYETLDFPLTTFSPGPYSETLRWVALEPGGRTGAAKYGGVVALFVLEGSIRIHAAAKAEVTVAADHGANELPETATQIFNQASGRSTFLAFYVTAADQPFETPVDQSP
jgi:hypothetical protein